MGYLKSSHKLAIVINLICKTQHNYAFLENQIFALVNSMYIYLKLCSVALLMPVVDLEERAIAPLLETSRNTKIFAVYKKNPMPSKGLHSPHLLLQLCMHFISPILKTHHMYNTAHI